LNLFAVLSDPSVSQIILAERKSLSDTVQGLLRGDILFGTFVQIAQFSAVSQICLLSFYLFNNGTLLGKSWGIPFR